MSPTVRRACAAQPPSCGFTSECCNWLVQDQLGRVQQLQHEVARLRREVVAAAALHRQQLEAACHQVGHISDDNLNATMGPARLPACSDHDVGVTAVAAA